MALKKCKTCGIKYREDVGLNMHVDKYWRIVKCDTSKPCRIDFNEYPKLAERMKRNKASFNLSGTEGTELKGDNYIRRV